jgi:glycosyltransferase involved in cell wall biosynthesis
MNSTIYNKPPLTPLISCLMVTTCDQYRFNFLEGSIASYISQDYVNKELIILIDSWHESCTEQLQAYLSSLKRPDIHYIVAGSKLSLGALRNLSMANAKGDLFCQWDDDDLSHPRRLAAQAQFLAYGGYDATILTDNLHIFDQGRVCYWETGKRNLVGGRPCTLMVRKEHGLRYPESGPKSARGEDTRFLTELKTKLKVGYFEAPAFYYLYFFHGNNTMNSAHHRMLALRTSVAEQQVVENRDYLVLGIKQVVGFDSPTLTIKGVDGPLFTWSRFNDSIVFEQAKTAYRARKIVLLPSGKRGISLVHSAGASSLTRMPTPTAKEVRRMTDFKPLDEHAWDLYMTHKRAPSDPSASIDFLNGLAKDGFLISDEDLKAKIANDDEPCSQKQVSIQSFGVPTCGRPEALRRCIGSFLDNFREHSRKPRVIVADDSPLLSQQAKNLAILNELSASNPEFEFSYAGLHEKRRYSEFVAQQSGVDPNIIEFGLFNPENLTKKACGPNRNALFFETIGECFLSADDDTICRPVPSPHIRPVIEVTSVDDPTLVRLFPDQRTLLGECTPSNVDLVGVHESVLAKSLGAVLRSQPGTPVTFGHLTADFLSRLEKKPIRTKVAWVGIYGDPGSTYPTYYLWKDDLVYNQLTASEDAYHRLTISRQIFRAPPCVTFGAGGYCQSTVLAYDHRNMLPPFMPLRGLDIVFGKMLVDYYRDSVIGYLPWTVLHSPPRTVSNNQEDFANSAASIPYYVILLSLSGMHSPSEFEPNPAEAIGKLGEHLCSVGSLPAPEFEEVLRTRLWAAASHRIDYLSRRLRDSPRAPHYWSEDIQVHIDALSKRFTPNGLREALFINGCDFAQRLVLIQRLTVRFGDLLRVWSSLIEAAAELKSRGIQLARPVST